MSGVQLGRRASGEDSAHWGQLAEGLATLRQCVNELEMQLSFLGWGCLPSLQGACYVTLERVTQQDGSEAGRQVQNRDPGFWAVDLWA